MWLLLMVSAFAESWCASPIVAHEWGVQVFNGDGTRGTGLAIPDAYHRSFTGHDDVADVRDLPADGGDRCVPVISFFGNPFGGDVPLGVSVGFAEGDASAWYPQADQRLDTAAKHELIWQDLVLRSSPESKAPQTALQWPGDLRAVDDALWVEHGAQSERFLFYEGATTESADVRVSQMPRDSALTPALRIDNTGSPAIHDVIITQRQSAEVVWVYTVSHVAAGETTEVAGVNAAQLDTRAWLRERLVADRPAQQAGFPYLDGCVMMRDPSAGVSWSDDHRLYPQEAEVLLDAWSDRFFDANGVTVVYREDAARLKRAMPLSLYTDMYHYITLNRLGLVLVEDVEVF